MKFGGIQPPPPYSGAASQSAGKAMETRASFITVGVFVLLFLVGIVMAVLWLARVDVNTQTARYDILFDGSVTGLQVGNAVRYRGVPVGSVTAIAINPDNVEQVRVTIEVPDDTPIKQDTEAALEFQGITGVAFVQLTGGTNAAPRLASVAGGGNPIIPSRPSSLQEVIEQAPELINRFIAVVDRANAILSPQNQANIERTLGNIATLTDGLAEGSDDMRRVLSEGGAAIAELRGVIAESETLLKGFAGRSDELADLVAQTLDESRNLISEARPVLATGQKTLTQVGDTFERAQSTMDVLDGTLASGAQTLDKTGQLLDELTPRVPRMVDQAQVTLDDFSLVARDLRGAAANIARASGQVADVLDSNRDSVSEFTSVGLSEFTQLVSESRTLVAALTRISIELERDPARYLFGDRQKGLEVK